VVLSVFYPKGRILWSFGSVVGVSAQQHPLQLYCFAASIPFKVGLASIVAEAFWMAISIESALGGMLGDFAM
jgi:hypothetical protein